MKKVILCLTVYILALNLIACNKQSIPSHLDTLESTAATITRNPTETTATANESETVQQEETTTEASMPRETYTQSESNDINNTQTNAEQSGTTNPTVNKNASDPIHQHSYTSSVVQPTCTENGYTRYSCSCGSSYDDTETAARGHLYGNWETTIQPTTSAPGEKQCVCSRCGNINKESIPKLDPPASETYSSYIDPRISIEYSPGGAVSYFYNPVCVIDTRSWGDPPSISITGAGGFYITYLDASGNKVSVTLAPVEGYIHRCVLLENGSYTFVLIGDYKD